MTLALDFETRSAVDLRKTGSYVYAEDPSTDVWCAAYAVDDGPVQLWTPGQPCPAEVLDAVMAGEEISAFNAAFERTIWRHILTPRYGWPLPDESQWRCTMAWALAMALPGSLENAAAAVGIDEAKDMAGRRLMLQMSKPRRFGGPAQCRRCHGWGASDGETDYHGPCPECHGRGEAEYEDVPVWWDDDSRRQRLYAYCMQDVVVERELRRRLLPLSPAEQALWHLDQRVNDRGVFVDEEFCRAAQKVVAKIAKALDDEMEQVTGGAVSKCSQTHVLTAWLREQGVDATSVAKDVLADLLIRDDLPEPARRALELRQEAAKTSTAKIDAFLTRRSANGRMSGNLQFHGAGTGRWAGRGAQLQNLPRPSTEDHGEILAMVDALSTGDADLVGMLYQRPLTVVSDCIRGMLCAAPGNTLFSADFSAVEARGLAWLAGQEDVIRAFRDGVDIYNHAASGIFGRPIDRKKQLVEGQVGKVSVLALGYQGGVGAFLQMAKTYGLKIGDHFDAIWPQAAPEHQERAEKAWADRGKSSGIAQRAWMAAEVVKIAWRAANPYIEQLWHDLEAAAVAAVNEPGTVHRAGRYIAFRKVGSFLWCQLPSGRVLCYPYAEVIEKKTPWGSKASAVRYKCVDQFTRRWEWKDFYGGLSAENVTSGVCRDLMAAGMVRVEGAGYPVILTVHDEIVSERPENTGSLDEFVSLMSALPEWATGFPLKAAGWTGIRYRK